MANAPEPVQFVDGDLYAEVLNELRALHHTSDGKGATIPEIVQALTVRGIVAPPLDVEHVLWAAPATHADMLTARRKGHRIWTPSEVW